MRGSFDPDDTQICRRPTPAEPPFPRWRHPEPLRRGAVGQRRDLRARGCSTWIYPTSYRPPAAVRRWLRAATPGSMG